MSFDDRQAAAFVTGMLVLFGVPVLVCAPLLFLTAWVVVLGGHPHVMLWGWLSDTHVNEITGAKHLSPATWLAAYPLCVASVYIVYQLCELAAWGFMSIREAYFTPIEKESQSYVDDFGGTY